jgi:SAM-dependent methyltransferase
VLDPYCGSGTSVAVAKRLGRRAIGIDESPVAVQVTLARLRAMGIAPTLERLTFDEERNAPGVIIAEIE